jgi:peptidoglycan hydrolase-like protein with peptidoglycan-binding domain
MICVTSAVERSTTSNDRAQHSQDASKSYPIILARRPPIPAHKPPQTLTCASPTAQQKARAFVDPALRDVASGKTELAKNAKGPAVQKTQEALQMAGYTLPRFGADGKFGDESAKALKKFQTDHCLKVGSSPGSGWAGASKGNPMATLNDPAASRAERIKAAKALADSRDPQAIGHPSTSERN